MNNHNGRTLVLGLGNPILSDDGIGCHVALALKEKLKEPEVDVLEASIAGLDFLDLLAHYDRAIIIDAIQTREGTPGQIYRFEGIVYVNSFFIFTFSGLLYLFHILYLRPVRYIYRYCSCA